MKEITFTGLRVRTESVAHWTRAVVTAGAVDTLPPLAQHPVDGAFVDV